MNMLHTWIVAHPFIWTACVSLLTLCLGGGLAYLIWQRGRELSELGALSQSAFEGLILHRSGKILNVNHTFALMVGMKEHELRGLSPKDLFEAGWPEGDLPYLTANKPGALKKGHETLAVELQTKRLKHTHGYVTAVRDLRQIQNCRDDIRRLATHDTLTQLPRRGLFLDAVNTAINQASTDNTTIALARMDVVSKAGLSLKDLSGGRDTIISQCAQGLRASVPSGTWLGKLGDNSFALLLKDLKTCDDVSSYLERLVIDLRTALAGSPFVEGLDFRFGVALYPNDSADGESLLQHAQKAFERKTEDVIFFYDETLNKQRQQRFAMETALDEAIEMRRIDLAYQAQACLMTGRITGFEALARWPRQDPPVQPSQFLPMAEDKGLMLGLGRIILKRAFERLKLWPESLSMSVNLAVAQLDDPELENQLDHFMKESGIDPARMCFEVSESTLATQTEAHFQVLERIRARGFKLALDEFGKDRSNLQNLSSFKFDQIKISRPFIEKVDQDSRKSQLLGALINLARALDSEVMGVGAENQAEMDMLRRLNCDGVQGFVIGQPVLGDGVVDFMQRYMLTMMNRVVPNAVNSANIEPEEKSKKA